jgi:hypothetical protein
MNARKKPDLSVVDEESVTRDPSLIATLPFLDQASELLLDCAATGGIGVIAGPPGSGKTVALKRLAARYSGLGLPGACLYYCCQQNAGTTRGVKDILMEFGIGGAIIAQGHGASMQMILKLALRDFQRRNLRCLLLDESQRFDVDAMNGVVALHDHLREHDHPTAIVVASNVDTPEWLVATESARTRTLKILRSAYPDTDHMLGIMSLWADEFVRFADMVDSGNKGATDLARKIHTRTGGNLRRLNFFAKLFLRHHAGQELSLEIVESVFRRMAEGEEAE